MFINHCVMHKSRNFYTLIAKLICAVVFFNSCRNEYADIKPVITHKDLWVDTSVIPKDTVAADVIYENGNGIFMLGDKKFSGYIKTVYPDKKINSCTSVYDGMMHGIYRSYYENGQLHEIRQYKENLSTGRHYGFWKNGNKQFDYLYYRDKKVGFMNRWYEDGKPYMFLNYADDKEEGVQRGWRTNGKLFINYIAKDGFKYGLQETMLCYKLDAGKIVN